VAQRLPSDRQGFLRSVGLDQDECLCAPSWDGRPPRVRSVAMVVTSGLKGPRFESRCGKRQILTIGKRGKLWGEFLTMPMLMMMITMPPVHDAAVIVVAL